MGALSNYFQRRGQIAQHNARILAAQRGLMPFPDEQPAPPTPPAPPAEIGAGGGGTSGAGDEPWNMPPELAAVLAILPPILGGPTGRPHYQPPPPQGPPVARPKLAMNEPLRALPMPAEAEQFQPPDQGQLGEAPDVFWTEGGKGAPVSSYSNVFGQTATFQPGTVIRGRGTVDPLKEQEWRAMQAAIDDYSRKRMAVESANQIPEGRMREMWADNPEAAAQAQARMQQALAQGLQALGPQPSRALPSEVERSAARAQAQGKMEAQPYVNAAELAAILGLAERNTSPAYSAAKMAEARVGAESQLQQPVLDKGAIDTARLVDINKARGNSLYGDIAMTPGQEGAMTDQAPGEPGTTERRPGGTLPGTGMQIRMANVQRYAAQYNIPVAQAQQRMKALGYTIVP